MIVSYKRQQILNEEVEVYNSSVFIEQELKLLTIEDFKEQRIMTIRYPFLNRK
ncbi:MAG: hypothetical protein LBL16_00810 [Endomicrobium sp.]|nr:hypothetical protein [Endomicrobium sp.]